MIPVFERAKTGHALDRAATVIGESDHSPLSNAEVKNVEPYLHSLICRHGTVLN
jgi:hypothetical protein